MAKQNARVYGVEDRIEFIQGKFSSLDVHRHSIFSQVISFNWLQH